MAVVPTVKIQLSINGSEVAAEAPASLLLLDFLRDHLHLTGAKRGCDVQVCGACTVLVDGRPTSSCCLLVYDANGSAITTCEGLGFDATGQRLQAEFVRRGAFQCGYCTPGMLVSATALLHEIPRPTHDDVREFMQGNLCRCTGYAKIIEAIISASE